MEISESISELATALAKAQGQMEGAAKDGLNPHFKSRYATLASVWEAARGPLSQNGLSVVQATSTDAERVTITTLLAHSSGQWIKETLTMSSADGRPQSVGSVISYGRRYQLAALVGIAPEDDDAEAAEGRSVSPQQAPRPTPQAPRVPTMSGGAAPAGKPNGRTQQGPPPISDKDIPFMWLLALLPALARFI